MKVYVTLMTLQRVCAVCRHCKTVQVPMSNAKAKLIVMQQETLAKERVISIMQRQVFAVDQSVNVVNSARIEIQVVAIQCLLICVSRAQDASLLGTV